MMAGMCHDLVLITNWQCTHTRTIKPELPHNVVMAGMWPYLILW